MTLAQLIALLTPMAVAAGDESDADDTLHNDAELVLAVEANAVYTLESMLLFTTGTSTTPDVKLTFSLPASATLTWWLIGYTTAATLTTEIGTLVRYQDVSVAVSRGVLSTATTQATPYILMGTLRVAGTAGNLQLQWAQNTTTGGTPTVRKADSFLKLTRVF